MFRKMRFLIHHVAEHDGIGTEAERHIDHVRIIRFRGILIVFPQILLAEVEILNDCEKIVLFS